MRKIKISISPATAVFIVLFALINYSPYLLITVAAALLHEFGHIMAAVFSKVRVNKIILYPFGADIQIAPGQIISYKNDIFIKSAGIMANLTAVLGSYLYLVINKFNGNIFSYDMISKFDIGSCIITANTINAENNVMHTPITSSELAGFFLLCNLGTAVINAVPIGPLDGGGVLKSVLSLALEPGTVMKITEIVSFGFIIILWIAACYFIMYYGTNFNLFIICGYLFAQLFLVKK